MANQKDNFLVTFSKPVFEETANFFFPHQRDNKNNMVSIIRRPSPKGAFQIKMVFDGKPRSPTRRLTVKDVTQPYSTKSMNNSQQSQENSDVGEYYIQPNQKTSQLKRRLPILDFKKQLSQASSRKTKLPQVEINIASSNLNTNNNNSLRNDENRRINNFNQKGDIEYSFVRQNDQQACSPCDEYRYGKKIDIIHSRILNIKHKKVGQNTNTKMVNSAEAENNPKKKEMTMTKTANWAEFGVMYDEETQKNSSLRRIDSKTLQKLGDSNLKPHTQNIYYRTNEQSREQSPKSNSKSSGRSFLMKKQQMAILNKLFSRNCSSERK